MKGISYTLEPLVAPSNIVCDLHNEMNTAGCQNTSNNLPSGFSALDLCFCFKTLLSCGAMFCEVLAVSSSDSSSDTSPESSTG